ncbi:MAG: PBP1A family penicillin-binding protein [Pseudomonadota bacterium]|nr:PBP1A family penicillin-binding protein [Pseudomonadota bacterium]
MASLRPKLRMFLTVAVFGVLLFGICLAWLADTMIARHSDALDAIVNHQDKDNTRIYANDGKVIAEVYSEFSVYVPYAEIPQIMIDAVIAIEDRNFFQHAGFDVKAVLRAAIQNLKKTKITQGGSTITQQLVKNYSLTRERTWQRKIKEVFLAFELERILPKEQILAVYLNNLYLGNRAYGIGAAAGRYFGLPLAKLNAAELVMIAGLFRSPNRDNPQRSLARAKLRQQQVLQALLASGKITAHQKQSIERMPLRFKEYVPQRTSIAPHFVDHVIKESEKILNVSSIKDQGYRIHTTLDLNKQLLANRITQDIDTLTSVAKGMEVGLISVNPRNGHILAMIGGRDYQQSKFNRATQALRQPGSAFKPIVYSYALMNGIAWSDMAFVAPVSVDEYRPREQRNEIMRETTLYRSFYKSLNLPVVELGNKLGIKRVIKHAQRFGINTALKDELGTVLGSSEIRITEMANIYSVFANAGKLTRQSAITKIIDRHGKTVYQLKPATDRTDTIISEQISFLMTSAMQDVFHRGTASKYRRFHTWAAGKTGTSDAARDNWFCGFSSDLVTIVWLGSDSNASNSGSAFGATVALPIWAAFMAKAVPPQARQGFDVPDGVDVAKVNPRFGNIDSKGVRMYFLHGKVPSNKHSPFQSLTEKQEYRGLFKWN